ncbi:GNAT family N-acetyltransferase [Yersinia pseudotuberculosis]|uniref:GNAT family N-acetyltransferase n=1 Tax=Yersinia pseudotuberculosis TaxID=633 RepID=UPI001A9CE865|nr:GNAT family N-acetyltransferase [Yersinia pseudotuberculosis]MBO1552099.1 GNAT family N-acetyltransferase [Yersinia pseudotuberculosis]MBO1572305.1 GNAT family N-acetyltransferase [Yersinia pseudotuberculosis]MBO1587195.1 GNAT family N-acetyltransferase [Yersinia pseudotuberculosis]MBO1636739.1 GNAT family N-acetyltransferase [Yersinia pseudotuberculosis]
MAQKIIPEYIISAADNIIGCSSEPELPFFLFDADNAIQKARTLISDCKYYFNNYEIAISLKSCSLGLFCKLMAQEGLSAEACSADEIQLATAAGFSDDRIILDGPFKLTSELSLALGRDILIHIDSVGELLELEKLAQNSGKKYGVGIRISHYYSEGERSRFGVTEREYIDDILPLISNSDYLYLKGFHLHVGSNLSSPDRIIDNLREWLPFLVKNMPDTGHLDLGSGFPSDSFSSDEKIHTIQPSAFFKAIYDLLANQNADIPKNWKMIFEPGRYLSEDSGYACGKAFGYKWRYNAQVIQTNLGVNWIPSIHNWSHSLTILGSSEGGKIEEVQIIAGFNCFENDCLFPKNIYGLKPGQHFLIRGCGSYDMQTGNEWTRRKPPVYAYLNGSLLTARITQPLLSSVYNDLLQLDEMIFVDHTIQLVSPSRKFATALFEIINHNRDDFSKYMAWPRYVNKVSDTQSFLDVSYLAHQKDESKTYVILYKNAPVGLLSFNSIDKPNKTAYIGYWLDMRVQGNGIITRSIKKLVEQYYYQNTIKRFVIKCSTANKKSNDVARRCGFQIEGVFKEAEFLNGVFYDQNIYAWIAQP